MQDTITKNMEKVLIIRRFGSLGDILMSTPALKELSKNYKIDVLVPKSHSDIFKNLNFINQIIYNIESPQITTQYDKFIDLTDFEFNYEQVSQPLITKTKQEMFAEALNVSISSFKPIIELSKEENDWIDNYIQEHSLKNILILAVKSANTQRDWNIDNWIKLIDKIKKLNYSVVVVDKQLSWDDKDVHFFNNHTMRELFALVSKADIVVAQDSGILHIAGAFDIPNLTIYGPTDYRMRSIYKDSYHIESKLPCYPCWYKRCPHLSCINCITVETVENKLLEVLQNVI